MQLNVLEFAQGQTLPNTAEGWAYQDIRHVASP